MNPLLLLALGLLLLGGKKSQRTQQQSKPAVDDTPVRALIRERAIAHGVPPRLALATARAESNFQPAAEGDLHWHEDRARYAKVVPSTSPFFAQSPLWHSYGLFQLLAPYHVQRNEDPRVLLDPRTNADRGTAFLAALLKRYGDDWDTVRLAYAGALNLSDAVKQQILTRWHNVLAQEPG